MGFISLLVTQAEGSTWRLQRKVWGSALQACRNEFGWLTEPSRSDQRRHEELVSMFTFHWDPGTKLSRRQDENATSGLSGRRATRSSFCTTSHLDRGDR